MGDHVSVSFAQAKCFGADRRVFGNETFLKNIVIMIIGKLYLIHS